MLTRSNTGAPRMIAAGFAVLTLAGCAQGEGSPTKAGWATSVAAPAVDPRYGVAASPQLAPPIPFAPPPRVRGTYKIGTPYRIAGRWYVPREDAGYDRVGVASWYGPGFHGRKTANGEIFDQSALTAAHPTLPMPSLVEVTNLANGRRTVVRVNDRGPYAHDRIIDLSKAVAERLGFVHLGTARVRVRFVGRAPLEPDAPNAAPRRFASDAGPPDAIARLIGRGQSVPRSR